MMMDLFLTSIHVLLYDNSIAFLCYHYLIILTYLWMLYLLYVTINNIIEKIPIFFGMILVYIKKFIKIILYILKQIINMHLSKNNY